MSFVANDIQLRPLQETDIDLLITWFKEPHVAYWWATEAAMTDEELFAKYSRKIAAPQEKAFVVLLAGKPIGYVQVQDTSVANGWWENEPPGTWSLDILLGDNTLLGKGLGTLIVQEAVAFLFTNAPINRIICDPHPHNVAAIRCYEKAGFKQVGERLTPDGEALLMVVEQ